MRNKLAFLIFLSLTFYSCGTDYNYIYDSVDKVESERYSHVLEESGYLKSDELWLIFYTGFYNTNIKLYENSKVTFDSVLSTPKEYPKLTKAFKINKNSKIEINSTSFTKPLLIKKDDMKNYKSIYISRRKNKIEIHFTDTPKFRIDEAKENAKASEKHSRKVLRDSLKALKNNQEIRPAHNSR